MTNYYSGGITVTKNLFLKLADQDFIKFTGMDMYASVAGVFSEEDAAVIRNAPRNLKYGEFSTILRLKRSDGVYREVLVRFSSMLDADENFIHMEITELAAVTEGKKMISDIQKQLDTYIDILGSVVLKYECVNDLLEISYVTGSTRRINYSGSLGDWIARLLDGGIDPESNERLEALRQDMTEAKSSFVHTLKIRGFLGGSDLAECCFNCRGIKDADGNGVVLGCIDAGSDKMKSVMIDPVNDKDSFLDMLNKRAIIEQAKRILSLATIRRAFIIILDLDNFKSVNDTYGHITGDEVLTTVTRIINENLGRRGVVGRVGGDEILMITETIDEQTELRNMLRSIRTGIEWTFKEDPRDINVTCSIGACAYPENGKDFNSLFELADKMLYIAKAKGKNRYIIYTPELHDPLLARPADAPAEAAAPTEDFTVDKIGIMHRLVDNYLIRHSYNNEKIFTEVGLGFSLDEILMVYEDFTNLFQWTPELGVTTDIRTVPYFMPDSSFGELFDKDKLLILDGLYKLDGKCPEVEKSLTDKGIKSAMFYRIDKMGKFSGYVMFARRKQRQMWSDYEAMALSTVAKVFDVSMHE